MWQCRHAAPLEQPCGFQNHTHGRQRPVPWRADPRDGNCFLSLVLLTSTDGWGFTSLPSSTAASASCSGAAEFVTAFRARTTARRELRRTLSSAAGHAWQWSHSVPLWQPCGFLNQAHGLHFPILCKAAPREARPNDSANPGGGKQDTNAAEFWSTLSGTCGAGGGMLANGRWSSPHGARPSGPDKSRGKQCAIATESLSA
mmetsp:Transcript_5863/g.13985  ORF Transcript_5863/g.13985 Transcript_5863/m.13985 type:complete len:201 (+) Transcript_5863:363-965(+)